MMCSKVVLLIALLGNINCKTFQEKFQNISSTTDCKSGTEYEDLFGPRDNFYRDAAGNVFCFRERNGVSQMSSTSRDFEDPRFMCSNGPMTWYRGRRNLDHRNKPCLFWASIPNATFDISDGASSSYSMKRILPDEYENFCRNPNKNPLGPWCYVDKKLQSPCFQPCKSQTEVSKSKFSCLNKEGFPYTDYDMTDILDSPQLIQVFENVHLMYESRYVLPMKVNRLSTKTCINSDQVAKYFGPWIAVFNDFSKEFIKGVGRKKLREICDPTPFVMEEDVHIESSNSSIIKAAISEDELTIAGCTFWRRCFSSCQDDAALCWNPNDQAGYFGTKMVSVKKNECLPWTQVASDILGAVRRNASLTSNYHLYYELLFGDPHHFFVDSRLFLNIESSCMLLARRSNQEKIGQFPTRFSKKQWDSEFEKLFQQGPGCFVHQNKTLTFEQCYSNCSKVTETVTLTKSLCLEKGEFSVCKPPRSPDWLIRGRKSEAKVVPLLIPFTAVFIVLGYRYI